MSQVVACVDVPASASIKEINLATRALAFALSQHGWPGELITRYRGSMISLGGYEETCLQWKGEWFSAAGQSFSRKMMSGAPSDIRIVPADQAFPPLSRPAHGELLGKMDAAVQVFILRRAQQSEAPGLDAPRPRI